MMNINEFHEQLRQTGAYRTPPAALPARPYRPGVMANLRYLAGQLYIIGHGMACANRGQFDRLAWATHGFWFLQLAERLGAPVSFDSFVAPRQADGPLVWAANHMSAIETMILPSALLAFGDVAVVAKRSLTRYPVFGASLRATDPIVVRRVNPRDDLKTVLTQGGAMLAKGRSVLLFPQSTRTSTFDPARFNSLGVKLAIRAGVPLVPVALRTDFAGMGKWLRDPFGPVDPTKPLRFRAGPHLPPTMPPRVMQQATLDFVTDSLREWSYPVRDTRSSTA